MRRIRDDDLAYLAFSAFCAVLGAMIGLTIGAWIWA